MNKIYLICMVLLISFLGCRESAIPSQSEQTVPRPVIISSDTGVEMDDIWTLAHVALSPEFDLLGMVTAHGPVIVEVTEEGIVSAQQAPPDTVSRAMATIARTVLNHLPLQNNPPVFPGANRPLAQIDTPAPSDGLDFLLKASQDFSPDSRLTILMLGPATDIASAILSDSTIVDRIEVVAMAYNKWPLGTDEFNVNNDIGAWQVLMHSRTPLVVGDSTVTAGHLKMNREHADALFGEQGPSGTYLSSLLKSWLDNNTSVAEIVSGDPDSWPVWDEVTTAYLLGLTTQQMYPRPILKDDMTFDHTNSEQSDREITWITSIDEKALWMDFSSKLNTALQRP